MSIVIYIFAFTVVMSLADNFNNDKKIFGTLIAKKNLSYSVKISVFILIYFAIFIKILGYLTLSRSLGVVENIFLLLSIIPMPVEQLASRFLINLTNVRKEMGSLIEISRFSMISSQKLSQFLFVLIFSFVTIKEYLVFPINSDSFLNKIYFLLCFIIILSLLIPLFDKIEFREKGVCGSYFSAKWNEIEAYRWERKGNILHVQHMSRYPFIKHLKFKINSNKKNEIIALLDLHLSDRNSE